MKLLRVVIILFGFIAIDAYAIDIDNSPDVKSFVGNLVKTAGLNQSQLEQELTQAKFNPEILQKIHSPENQNNWYIYKNILTTEQINDGVAFWKQHEKELNQAKVKYGISPEVIVAVIGIESDYGKKKYNYRVLDTLATLSFAPSDLSHFEKDFFRKQLTDFLILANKYHLDVNNTYGTYAGAMGIAHFMPSSYLRFAVDFNHDGKVDLNNPVDAIGAVAAYMNWRGWKANEPIAVAAKVTGTNFKTIPVNQSRHEMTLKQFEQAGVVPGKPYSDNLTAYLVELGQPNEEKYWLVFDNFNTLYQFNPNVHFAIAVHRLAEEIARAKQDQVKTK